MLPRFLLLTTILSVIIGLQGAEVITNASSAVAFVDASPPANCEFALTGTVVVTLNRRAIVLSDATGSIHLHCDETIIPEKGDVVGVCGKSFNYNNLGKILEVDEIVHLGQTRLPDLQTAAFDDILRGKCFYRNVLTCGTVVNAFRDDIDARYNHLVLKSGPHLLHATLPERNRGDRPIEDYIGAEIEVSGICLRNYGGSRVIVGTVLALDDDALLRIVRPASDTPYEAPPLEDIRHVEPALVAEMGLRSIEGTVIAVWHDDRFMVGTDDDRSVIVTLAGSRKPPAYGSRVRVFGTPETDLFHVNLADADFRLSDKPSALPRPERLNAEHLFSHDSQSIKPKYHGHAISIRGTVRSASESDRMLTLECGTLVLPIDISATPELFTRAEHGSLVDISGIVVIEADSWRPNVIFPRVKGFRLITRTHDDIVVVRHPPWWTPGRLMIVIGSLLAALVGILIWNRILNHLVERRSRELLKERLAHTASELKIGERTRLAVELHDSLSQNLEGIACQVAATRTVLQSRPEGAATCLDTAERMLDSCRLELKRCLFDLRGHALEERDFATAIRTTLAPLCDGIDLFVRFDVRRAHFNDTTAHATLCMIRELVSNALRHGHAKQVRVAGEYHDGTLSFSVRDNGCGFDLAACQGPEQGHFGIEGIRERAGRFDGTTVFESEVGKGTRVTVTLKLDTPAQTQQS